MRFIPLTNVETKKGPTVKQKSITPTRNPYGLKARAALARVLPFTCC